MGMQSNYTHRFVGLRKPTNVIRKNLTLLKTCFHENTKKLIPFEIRIHKINSFNKDVNWEGLVDRQNMNRRLNLDILRYILATADCLIRIKFGTGTNFDLL